MYQPIKSAWFFDAMVNYKFKVVDNMIKCKDCAPWITERGPFGGAAEYEFFSEVVSAANQSIESITIQVINVEIVVLPDQIEGTSDDVYGVVSNGFYPVMRDNQLLSMCASLVQKISFIGNSRSEL